LLEERDREGLHVDCIRGVGIRLNRRRIAVHQDDPHPFFPERPAGLGTRVVELRGLADHAGPGADHHGGPNVRALGPRPTPVPRCPNFNLNVFPPKARARSWCPRQMPRRGTRPASSRLVWTEVATMSGWAGSPGPFDRMTPSGFRERISSEVVS